VNGYYFENGIGSKEMLGLRLKARADLFYREKNYASAVKFYEEASGYLPDETDIYFNLGNIYMDRGVINLAVSYYKLAQDKFFYPENRLKSKRNYYLSLVRYGITLVQLSRTRNSDDALKMAKEIYWKISRLQPEMTNNFPETISDVSNLGFMLFGNAIVNKK
jgi:tetratricopeptide (TPR) repeat protein